MSEARPRILVPGKINQRILDRLPEMFETVRIERADVELVTPEMADVAGVAVSGRLPVELMDALPRLEIIGNFGVGYDGVDVARAAARGIVVTNTPDVLTEEVADTAVGLLLNTLRRLPQAEQWLRQGRWVREGAFPLSPLSLRGRKVGLFGLGRIGLAIARRLEAFAVPIAYHTRSPREGLAYAYHSSLKSLAEAVDTMIVIVPGTPSTLKAVNADILAALGPEGVLINVGRGSTVDEAALVAALQNGVIAGAGLDVFENEPHVPEALLTLPNVSLLPHVASASVATRNAMSDLVVDNLKAWFSTGEALTPVVETPFRRKG
ncbi:2-hydroxyacid dehydrogenase [Sinorhizobium terangae]|uniref:2-hydroxyacid dehydrogenase n=1 Tax=Sinorhizobium terangae TaxID=110322 RepID=A0A6N7L9H4_SINTE|nr:2-hydroxyacid dehydrogenase [Sinorhizobium terangae]MBB4186092.1 lactate dehydrogenase-like 2-hydroxyacid dehydrogenase [Sinorhizobium terangae]MQX13849.1 2-hydroxyacid dehydrogenase [Sinorhizobium terangae]WFU47074.1 2-hydroxyacid dehydrogenase [Sinorhizobium terangae]